MGSMKKDELLEMTDAVVGLIKSSPLDVLNTDSGMPFNDILYIDENLTVKFNQNATCEDIEKFEDYLSDNNQNLVPTLDPYCVQQKLVNGMYLRVLLIPKDMVITGRMHKNHYLDLVAYGDMTVESYLHDGTKENACRYKGFHIFNGVPGRKRVVHTYQNTLWITIDRTDVEDVDIALSDITVEKRELYKKLLEEK
jgi:hypothetical protein